MTPPRQAFEVIRDVVRAARIFQQDNVHCGGVTFQQFVLLDHVAQAGGTLELAELHALLAVEKSTTTRLVDALVEKGLLDRVPSERDPRARRAALTDAGRDAHATYEACLAGTLRAALASVPPADAEEMVLGLRRFAALVDRASAARCCG